MKKWITNKIIWFLAFLGFFILTWINKKAVRKVYGSTKGYDYKSAYNLDRFANAEFKTWFNRNFLTPKSKHHFGNMEETLSSVIGKNQRDGTLSKKGLKWQKIIDSLDKSVENHCLHWINNEVNYQVKNFDKYFINNKINGKKY